MLKRTMLTLIILLPIAIIICIFLDFKDSKNNTYEIITMEEAIKIMEEKEDYIILDVRTFEEYNSGHIPNAICIPNENIINNPPKELPNKNQLILIYCRSGNRSKQASEKLVNMGYTNIKEFGGIIYWNGEVEK